MICLDTNYLIRGLAEDTPEANELLKWHRAGEPMISAAPAWYEFVCGPVTDEQVYIMRAFLTGGIPPFDELHAREAARLFNLVGRVRRLRIDAMIAATATLSGSQLATSNRADFDLFRPLGLKLV